MPTRLTSLELDASPGNPNAVFAPAVLTTAEINAIPLANLRAGGIVYNISVGNLQTYTINGWENFALSGGGTDVFDNITVNNVATISTLHVTNTSTVGIINSSGNITTTGTVAAFDVSATGTIGTSGANLSAAGVNATAINSANTIYGPRPSGAFHFVDNAQTIVFSGTQSKLSLVTTSDYLNQFDSPVAGRLRYVGIGQSPIQVLITFSYGGAFSTTGTLAFDLHKNNTGSITTSTAGICYTSSGTGGASSCTVTAVTSMAINDYIEAFVSGTAGTMSFMNYNMFITQI
jgi:hypothetical protein